MWLEMRDVADTILSARMVGSQQERILQILDYNDNDMIKQNRRIASYVEWRDNGKPITNGTPAITKHVTSRICYCIRESQIPNTSKN